MQGLGFRVSGGGGGQGGGSGLQCRVSAPARTTSGPPGTAACSPAIHHVRQHRHLVAAIFFTSCFSPLSTLERPFRR